MEKIFNVKLEKDDANALLNCKSCKKKISISIVMVQIYGNLVCYQIKDSKNGETILKQSR